MDKTENILWQAKHLSKTNWLQATRLLESEISKGDNNYSLQIELGNIYFNYHVYTKAIKTYQSALTKKPGDKTLIFKLGNSFLSLNEYVLAIAQYEKISTYFPELLYNQAYAYAKIGNLDESIHILKKLIRINKYSQVPYVFLAEIYYTQGKFDLAVKYLTDAEKRFGKQGPISYIKGLAYSNLHNWLKAFIEFNTAEKLNIKSHQLYHSYGLACEKIGKIDRAISFLQKSLILNPSGSACYLDLIRIYLDQDRIFEAYGLIQQAKRNIPFSVPLSILYNQVMQKVNIENTTGNIE